VQAFLRSAVAITLYLFKMFPDGEERIGQAGVNNS